MNFLVDANLPRKLSWFNKPGFVFVADWGDNISDSEIWDYAIANSLIILTRDSDYFYRMIQAKTFPKVIYFRLQQHGRKDLEEYLSVHWEQICTLIRVHKMVIAYVDFLDVF